MEKNFADYCRELTETVGRAYQENLRLQHEAMIMSEYIKIKDAMVMAAKMMQREYTHVFGRDFSTEDLQQIVDWLSADGLEDVTHAYNGDCDNYTMTIKW